MHFSDRRRRCLRGLALLGLRDFRRRDPDASRWARRGTRRDGKVRPAVPAHLPTSRASGTGVGQNDPMGGTGEKQTTDTQGISDIVCRFWDQLLK